MFCQKCSLHYPDHLSFCRRCGQTLVHSNAETTVESHCCTRCGARVVRGENFCQHCGNRASVALQETVIGACYHCGTSWRSGWIYCKNCGLDRKRALLLSTSTPPPSPSNLNTASSQQLEEFPELSKINCKSCGTEAKPYSKFCEACGKNLVGSNANKTESASSVQSIPNPLEPQSQKLNKPEAVYQTSPTIFEPKALSESDRKVSEETPQKSGSLNNFSAPLSAAAPSVANNFAVKEVAKPANFLIDELQDKPLPVVNSAIESEESGTQAKTVVTPLPPFGGGFRSKNTGSFVEPSKQNSRLILQSSVLIALAFLLVLLILWWLKRDSGAGIFSSSEPSPALSPKHSDTASPAVSKPSNNASKVNSEEMAYIPGGKLEMGRNGGDEYETPVHSVSVNPFFIDRTEVSNEQYLSFISETGHRAPSHWRDKKFPSDEAKMPVVNVSWDDANAYAKWIGKRLPTEAEWEFAARGSDGRIYPWGNSWNVANANAGKTTGGAVTKVGSFPNGASQFGIMDMCGNVWEWTSSGLISYADEGKEIAPGKVIRGGAFDTPSNRATTTYRGVLPADRLRDKTGFRLAKDAK